MARLHNRVAEGKSRTKRIEQRHYKCGLVRPRTRVAVGHAAQRDGARQVQPGSQRLGGHKVGIVGAAAHGPIVELSPGWASTYKALVRHEAGEA